MELLTLEFKKVKLLSNSSQGQVPQIGRYLAQARDQRVASVLTELSFSKTHILVGLLRHPSYITRGLKLDAV